MNEWLLAALVGLCLICIVVLLARRPGSLQYKAPNWMARSESGLKVDVSIPASSVSNLAPTVPNQVVPTAKPRAEVINPVSVKSQETMKNFKLIARAEVDFPKQFNYDTVEIEDNMHAIVGRDAHSKSSLSAIAYKGDASPNQAQEFLQSPDAQALPNLKGAHILELEPPTTLPAPNPTTGLQSGTMWHARLSNGDDADIVLLRRKDTKGSYLFILSGSKTYFKNNDGAFDALYENFRALPVE